MPKKLTLSALTDAKVGTVIADPAVPGLRYQQRARGWTAQLRYKVPGQGWKSHGLGYVGDIGELIGDYLEARAEIGDDGRPLPIGLSVTPDDILGPVRDKARELRRRLRTGEDTQGGGITFGAVAAEFIERHVRKLAPRSQPEYRRSIEKIFVPVWGRKPLARLTRRDIVAVLDEVTDERGPVAANRALTHLQTLLGFAVNRHHIEVSPALGMKSPNPERPSDRTLSDAELAALWPAFEALGFPFGSWAQLLALTGARRTEAATMRWRDIEGLDGPEPVWSVRQKGDKPHLVPLAPQAAALLRSLPRSSDLVFSTGNTRRGKGKPVPTPISGFSDAKEKVDRLAPLADWRWHDLRRTMRTGLSRLRVAPHVAELVIGHAVTGLIKIYDRWDYAQEKRDALEHWEAHLASITSGGNVLPLASPRTAAAGGAR